MEEIKLTPEELKEAIDFGKFIGAGFFGIVFTYKGRLIKMDANLYQLLKINSPEVSSHVIRDRYRWDHDNFNDPEQLEELLKRQSKIRPRVPEGIITIKSDDSRINGKSPGIIIPYFENYEDLSKISKTDYHQLLILMKQVLDDIKSLADNEIAQEDLFRHTYRNNPNHTEIVGSNIIQKDGDAQIIDMSGPFVKVGKDFTGAKKMYSDFAKLMNYYYKANGLEPIYNEDNDYKEDDLTRMVNEFEKQTKKR